MKTESTPPAPASLLSGVLTVTVLFGLVGGLAWLAGVSWLYVVAFLVGGLPLSIALLARAMRRAPPFDPTPVPPQALINPFAGRFGVVAFWVLGLALIIPTFAGVVSSMGQYVVAPLAAAALAAWVPPERSAPLVGGFFYLTSFVLGVFFWHWSWQQLKPRHGAA
jgi:hypothetical protein